MTISPRQDQRIEDFVREANQREATISDLDAENEHLRSKLGLASDTPVDLTKFRLDKIRKKQEDAAVNAVLKAEVESLEEERVSLKNQIRILAQRLGGKAAALGLHSEDLVAIDKFTEELKVKKTGGDVLITTTSKKTSSDDRASSSSLREERLTHEKEIKSLGLRLSAAEGEKKNSETRLIDAEEENDNLIQALRELRGGMKMRMQNAEEEEDDPLLCPSLDRILAIYDAKRQLDKKNDQTLYLKAMADKAEGKVEELRRELKEAKREITRLEAEKVKLEAKRGEGEVGIGFQKSAAGEVQQHQQQQEQHQQPKKPVSRLPEVLPQSSSEIIHALNEELLEFLAEIESKDKSIASLETRTESFVRRVGVARQKLHLLYKQFAEKMRSLEEKEKAVDERLSAFEGDRENDAARLIEFERLLDTLDRNDSEAMRRIADVTRKISVLRVNEKILSRKYSLVSKSEKDLRKEAEKSRKELVETRGVVGEKMGVLRRRKETAEFKVAVLQSALSASVPTEEMERLQKEYNEIIAKYRDAMEKESIVRRDDEKGKRLEEENKTLKEGLEDLKKEVEIEKSKRTAMEAFMEEVRGRGGGGGEFAKSATLPTSAMTSSVRDSQLRTLSERLTMTEMKELNERQRANHADRMYERLKAALKTAEDRNEELEENFGKISKINLQLQSSESKMRDELLMSVPRSDLVSAKNEKTELEKTVNDLRQRASQYKESSDIALAQIEQINFFESCKEKERESFMLQLVELQARSDEAMKFGHLHRQIVSLTAREGAATIKWKDAERKIGVLTARLAAAEERADDSVNAAYHIRQETTTHIRQLKSAIFHLRKQYSGCVTLKQQEKFHKLVKETQERKKRVQEQLETLLVDDERLKEDLDAAAAKNETLTELLTALKGGGSGDATFFDAWEHPLKLWQTKVEELRSKEMKSNRLLSSVREELEHSKCLVSKREADIEELENENLKLIQTQEEQQLFWDGREAQLEESLKKFEARQKEIVSVARKFKDVAAAGRGGAIPNTSLPVGEQLDQAVQTIKTQLKEVIESRQKIKYLEDVVAVKKSGIRALEKQLTTREKVITELRRFIPTELDVDPILKETGLGHGSEQQRDDQQPVMDRETLDGALQVAKMKIESLQAEVRQKEESVGKLEAMLKAYKGNQDSVNAAHKEEVDALLSKVKFVQNASVERVKEDVRKSGEFNVGKNAELEKRLTRLSELERLVLEQDLVLANMATKVRKSKMEADKIVANLEGKVKAGEKINKELREELRKTTEIRHLAEAALEDEKRKNEELTTKLASLRDAEEHLKSVVEENEVLKREASRAPSKHAKALIERLKNDLALKESQQKALSKALTDLRADMVESAEERVIAHEARSQDDVNVQQIVDKAVAEALARSDVEVVELKQRTKELKEQLEAEKRRKVVDGKLGEESSRSKGDGEEAFNEAITERDLEISKLKIRNDQLIEQKVKARNDHEREIGDWKRKMKVRKKIECGRIVEWNSAI